MSTPAPVHRWLAAPPDREVEAALRRLSRCPDVRHVAVMPDVHLSGDVCVGSVCATGRLLYPGALGGDIGCGMAAVAFDAGAGVIDAGGAGRLFEALRAAVPSNRQARPVELPPALAGAELSHASLEAMKRRDARVQLGTLGRGNHFLEFQADEEERLWLMLHTGSRGIGQAIRDHHLARAVGRPLPAVDAESAAGRAFLADADWALAYARANRDAILAAVVGAVAAVFDVRPLPGTRVDCHHNFVRAERHFGEVWYVHRKGACSAAAGEVAVIPGSMGAASFHVEGRGHPESLCSCSHGAGRAMSRERARRAVSPRELERQMAGVYFDRGRARWLCDEAPAAYKEVRAVLRAERALVRIRRTLRPVLSYKGAGAP